MNNINDNYINLTKKDFVWPNYKTLTDPGYSSNKQTEDQKKNIKFGRKAYLIEGYVAAAGAGFVASVVIVSVALASVMGKANTAGIITGLVFGTGSLAGGVAIFWRTHSERSYSQNKYKKLGSLQDLSIKVPSLENINNFNKYASILKNDAFWRFPLLDDEIEKLRTIRSNIVKVVDGTLAANSDTEEQKESLQKAIKTAKYCLEEYQENQANKNVEGFKKLFKIAVIKE